MDPVVPDMRQQMMAHVFLVPNRLRIRERAEQARDNPLPIGLACAITSSAPGWSLCVFAR